MNRLPPGRKNPGEIWCRLVKWLVLLLLPALCAACSPSRDEQAGLSGGKTAREETGGAADVESSADSFTIRGGGGKKDFSFVAGGKVALPADFPEDVPLYPGAALRMAQKLGPRDVTVILGTEDSASEVGAFYHEGLGKKGWRFMGRAGLDEEEFLRFEKGQSAVAVVIAPEAGETVVSVAYKVKK